MYFLCPDLSEERQHIIEAAHHLFLSRGFRSVTMDDLARELKISKKTLYKHFTDKDELVNKCVANHIAYMEALVHEQCTQQETAIDEMLLVAKCLADLRQEMHPSVFFELEKYHQKAYELINKHKEDFVKRLIIENIDRGKKEGIYRENLDAEFTAMFYLNAMQELMHSSINGRPALHYLTQFFEYHLRGIASEKGLQLLTPSKFSYTA